MFNIYSSGFSSLKVYLQKTDLQSWNDRIYVRGDQKGIELMATSQQARVAFDPLNKQTSEGELPTFPVNSKSITILRLLVSERNVFI